MVTPPVPGQFLQVSSHDVLKLLFDASWINVARLRRNVQIQFLFAPQLV